MKEIDSQEHFVQEFETLIDKMDKNITDLAQYQRIEHNHPSTTLTEKLNRLKLHRTRLRNFLLIFKNASEGEWIGAREEAQEVFENAQKEYSLPSEELTNS